jgi:hypothetical protein
MAAGFTCRAIIGYFASLKTINFEFYLVESQSIVDAIGLHITSTWFGVVFSIWAVV